MQVFHSRNLFHKSECIMILLEITPNGKFLMIAFRGPVPVSVPHSAQGSCPGVGIVRLKKVVDMEGLLMC